MARHVPGLLLLLLPFALAPAAAQQNVPVQVLKISAGPAGSESGGVFALSEERSLFSRSTDREVLVFFQWADVPGPHRLVAQWRSPDGGASASSAIDYQAAERRFGARSTWDLPMLQAPGAYRVDVLIDGRTYWRGLSSCGPVTAGVSFRSTRTPV